MAHAVSSACAQHILVGRIALTVDPVERLERLERRARCVMDARERPAEDGPSILPSLHAARIGARARARLRGGAIVRLWRGRWKGHRGHKGVTPGRGQGAAISRAPPSVHTPPAAAPSLRRRPGCCPRARSHTRAWPPPPPPPQHRVCVERGKQRAKLNKPPPPPPVGARRDTDDTPETWCGGSVTFWYGGVCTPSMLRATSSPPPPPPPPRSAGTHRRVNVPIAHFQRREHCRVRLSACSAQRDNRFFL